MLRHQRRLGVASGLGVVKIPVCVGLQTHRELVEMLGHLRIVVERPVVVGLAVIVGVDQLRDLVAAGDEDFALDDFQAKRLKHAGGDARPRELLRLAVDAVNEPDIAHPRADCRAIAALEKVEPAQAHPRAIRVFVRRGDDLGHERARFAHAARLGFHRLRPAPFTVGLHQSDKIFRFAVLDHHRPEHPHKTLLDAGRKKFESDGFAGRDPQSQMAFVGGLKFCSLRTTDYSHG